MGVKKSETKRVTVRPAMLADINQALDLVESLGLAVAQGVEGRKAHIQRIWGTNPSKDEIVEPGSFGWLLECESRVVGFFGMMPRKYYWNGVAMMALVGTQWGVLKEYRYYILRLTEAFFNEPTQSLKLDTTTIGPVGKLWAREGGVQAPIPALGHTQFVPFNPGKIAAALPRFANIPLRRALALIDPLARLVTVPRRSTKGMLHAADPRNLPADWEDFWQDYRQNCTGLIASYDRADVQWIYGSDHALKSKRCYVYRTSPTAPITAFVAVEESPTALGSDLRRFKLLSLLCRDPALKKRVIAAALRLCRDAGADLLEFPLMNDIDPQDVPGIVLTRPFPAFPVYYWAKGAMAEHLKEPAVWHLSTYDGDAIFT